MKVLNEQELKAKLLEKIANKNLAENKSITKNLLNKNSNTELEFTSKDLEKTIEKYVIGLLSRREYSVFELQQKLREKAFDTELATRVLQQMIEQGLQSDQRFCDMFIRSRISKQSGPFKIRMELTAKGVSTQMINTALLNIDCDWFALALEAAKKKTALWKRFEFDDQAKLMRFLQGKGFEHEQIRYAVEGVKKLLS